MHREMLTFFKNLLPRHAIFGEPVRVWRFGDLSNRIKEITRLGATLRPTRAMQCRRAILDAWKHFEDQT